MNSLNNKVHINLDVIKDMYEIYEHDVASTVGLVTTFIKVAIEKIQLINVHLKNRNLLELSKTAHALKSSARTLGVVSLGDICQKLEDIAEQGDYAQIEILVYELKAKEAMVLIELERVIKLIEDGKFV